jgi:hypothetical protein
MKFTRGERRLIYLEAAGLVASADLSEAGLKKRANRVRFVCYALEETSGIVFDSAEFPEAYAFRYDETDTWLSDWTGEVDCSAKSATGNELRILILLFAAELCGDRGFNEQ